MVSKIIKNAKQHEPIIDPVKQTKAARTDQQIDAILQAALRRIEQKQSNAMVNQLPNDFKI